MSWELGSRVGEKEVIRVGNDGWEPFIGGSMVTKYRPAYFGGEVCSGPGCLEREREGSVWPVSVLCWCRQQSRTSARMGVGLANCGIL